MRKLFFAITLCFAAFLISCGPSQQEIDYAKTEARIIPQPNKINYTGGALVLEKKFGISVTDPSLKSIAEALKEDLSKYAGVEAELVKENASIIISKSTKGTPESYTLDINDKTATITAPDEAGAFYATRSLLLMFPDKTKTIQKTVLPSAKIEDAPRYGWRGVMLDESRHFFGKKKVMQILDMMALHKLNKFHWHLTDEPGWRLEIEKYPKLTTEGGKGSYCQPSDPAKFYTKKDIREVLDYASARFIEVIPEIDMPGHATAANRAYPEFSGGGSERYPDFTFNPGNPATYAYLEDILKETADLFPSHYLHYGGDEVHFGNHEWKTDRHVKALMKKEKLADIKQVEQYFNRRMADYIKSLGHVTMGWDEIVNAGVQPDNAVVMWWRHDRPKDLATAMRKGYKTILCPRVPLYFDFVQDSTHQVGRRWGGKFGDLAGVYNYPQMPVEIKGLDESLIMGIQGNVWTEQIQTEKRLDFMLFPRMTALSEAAWTQKEAKDFDNFGHRLKLTLPVYKREKIDYFDPFKPESTPEPEGCKKPA
ncbi:beta-N-acetylhexosaminidase [Fulvitalea axinellae]